MTLPPLPHGYTARHPMPEDFDAVFALTTRWSVAHHGAPDFNREELKTDWQGADFHLDTDAWVVVAPDGTLAGYADIWCLHGVQIGIGVRVDPSQQGHGIGTHVLALAELRGGDFVDAAPPGAEVRARQWITTADSAAQCILADAGYSVIRRYWRMKIELREPPPARAWPQGVTVRTLAQGVDERAIHAATEEAFADHWGHEPSPFEYWAQREIQRGDFDPTLWFIAMASDEIAGVAHARMNGDMGFIDELSVRQPWRRLGVGMALLHEEFAAFYRRGIITVGLGVDAGSQTGATQLYERAGMRVYSEWDVYEKVLRTAMDARTQ
jgi:mycothiol synthase